MLLKQRDIGKNISTITNKGHKSFTCISILKKNPIVGKPHTHITNIKAFDLKASFVREKKTWKDQSRYYFICNIIKIKTRSVKTSFNYSPLRGHSQGLVKAAHFKPQTHGFCIYIRCLCPKQLLGFTLLQGAMIQFPNVSPSIFTKRNAAIKQNKSSVGTPFLKAC